MTSESSVQRTLADLPCPALSGDSDRTFSAMTIAAIDQSSRWQWRHAQRPQIGTDASHVFIAMNAKRQKKGIERTTDEALAANRPKSHEDNKRHKKNRPARARSSPLRQPCCARACPDHSKGMAVTLPAGLRLIFLKRCCTRAIMSDVFGGHRVSARPATHSPLAICVAKSLSDAAAR